MKELIHNEIIARLNNLVQDIRFQKEQQWKTAYYNILIYGAIIAIFQFNVELSSVLFVVLQVLASIVICIVSIVLFVYQQKHYKTLQEYRQRELIIRNLLMNFVSDFEEIHRTRIANLIATKYNEKQKQMDKITRKEKKALQREINKNEI